MGTSKGYGGPKNGLVPSWADGDGTNPPGAPPPASPNGAPPGSNPAGPTPPGNPNSNPADGSPAVATPSTPSAPNPATVSTGGGGSLSGARAKFTGFGRTASSSRLGGAVHGYVSSVGGAKTAALRMGATRRAGGALMALAGDASATGLDASLRNRNLGHLVGKPAQEVFLGLVDFMCGPGGPIDEGISRQAMLEAIKGQLDEGITDFNDITPDVIKELFLDFVICSIEGKLISDIGAQALKMPDTVDETIDVENQVKAFISGATRDHVGALLDDPELSVNQANIAAKITQIYELAFEQLAQAGEDAE